MNIHSNPAASLISEQITEYDNQILALQNMKAKAKEELEKVLVTPPVLQQMKSLKRKFADAAKADFDRLRGLLRSEKVIQTQEEQTEISTKAEQKIESG